MRWICKDEIEECLDQAWRESAAAAKAELIDAADLDARKELLGRRTSSSVWRRFYELLPDRYKKKCWYCEANEIRSDRPVDHFRPKNKVEEECEHDGYWWLAYDWDNYRCACTLCNSRRNFEETSGGKACRFPLSNPDRRAFSPDDGDKLLEECPNFLDPFELRDEKLLWFDNDGKPMPTPDITDAQALKVKNSIDIFHLHESRISRERNLIRLEVERQIRIIKGGGDTRNAESVLSRMVRDTEKLSRAAIVYLSPYRSLPEVKDILQLD